MRSMGALELVASSTRRMMPAKGGVGAHRRCARTANPAAARSRWRAVTAVARRPSRRGRLSPVTADSSTDGGAARAPSPSTGTDFAGAHDDDARPDAEGSLGRHAHLDAVRLSLGGGLGGQVHEGGDGVGGLALGARPRSTCPRSMRARIMAGRVEVEAVHRRRVRRRHDRLAPRAQCDAVEGVPRRRRWTRRSPAR